MKSTRKSTDITIKDAMNDMMKAYRLDEKMSQFKLINAWPEIMGPAVAHRTNELVLSGNKLYVTLLSASLRQELFQDREQIIQRLNDAAGRKVIDDIIFK